MHFIQLLADHLMVGNIDITGVSSKGNDNVMDIFRTVFIWVVILLVIVSFFTKKYRTAISILCIGGILSVFIYGTGNIKSLGDSILKFLGVS